MMKGHGGNLTKRNNIIYVHFKKCDIWKNDFKVGSLVLVQYAKEELSLLCNCKLLVMVRRLLIILLPKMTQSFMFIHLIGWCPGCCRQQGDQ